MCDLEDEVRRLRDGYADLVEAAREVCTPVSPSETVEARLRACLARVCDLA